MSNVRARPDAINPIGRYHYFDAATVWIMPMLNANQRTIIESLCRGTVLFYLNGEHVRGGDGKWWTALYPDARYKQRIQMSQPTPQAFKFLSSFHRARISYLELALDWTFRSEEERDEAEGIFNRHHVKLHRRNSEVVFAKRTRYAERRGARTNMVSYPEEHSRDNGELHNLHLDWRIRGAAALRRAGIKSVGDLVKFDHRRFWSKRLLLYDLDIDRLGRRYNNHYRKQGRRGPWVLRYSTKFSYDMDRRTGGMMVRACRSTQNVLDQYAKRFNVRSCLIPIDVTHLLPDSPLM